MACSASSQSGATGGYASYAGNGGTGGNGGPGGNGGIGGDANAPLPLISCPFCGSRITTSVSRKGKRPGTRYYMCEFFSTGQCGFFEWREGYAQRLAANALPAHQAAVQPALHFQQDNLHLPRMNLIVSATNTIAILIVLAVLLLQFMWPGRN